MVYLGMRLLIGYQIYGNGYHVSQVSYQLARYAYQIIADAL